MPHSSRISTSHSFWRERSREGGGHLRWWERYAIGKTSGGFLWLRDIKRTWAKLKRYISFTSIASAKAFSETVNTCFTWLAKGLHLFLEKKPKSCKDSSLFCIIQTSSTPAIRARLDVCKSKAMLMQAHLMHHVQLICLGLWMSSKSKAYNHVFQPKWKTQILLLQKLLESNISPYFFLSFLSNNLICFILMERWKLSSFM